MDRSIPRPALLGCREHAFVSQRFYEMRCPQPPSSPGGTNGSFWLTAVVSDLSLEDRQLGQALVKTPRSRMPAF